jgi:hypothetical protein
MKLIIKTKAIELEYQDEYSSIEADVSDRIKGLIKEIYNYNALAQPSCIINTPIVGTVDQIFKNQ